MEAFKQLAEDSRPRGRRAEVIASQLRKMIIDGNLKPGDRLPTENELGNYFLVSRTTLREAVQMLRVGGYLDVMPGRGSFVCKPNVHQMVSEVGEAFSLDDVCPHEVKQIRLMLHDAVVRQACKASVDKRRQLAKYMLESCNEPEDNLSQESDWHLTMAEIAELSLHKSMLCMLLNADKPNRLKRFSCKDGLLQSIETQLRLNACIQDGDAETAGRVMVAYVKAGMKLAS